jgi:DNA-binding FadR family transcriptional regulator
VWHLISESVALIFKDHIIASADSREFHAVAVADHKKIAEAVLAENAPLAKKQMREHTERMIEFYRSQTPAIFSQLIKWR